MERKEWKAGDTRRERKAGVPPERGKLSSGTPTDWEWESLTGKGKEVAAKGGQKLRL